MFKELLSATMGRKTLSQEERFTLAQKRGYSAESTSDRQNLLSRSEVRVPITVRRTSATAPKLDLSGIAALRSAGSVYDIINQKKKTSLSSEEILGKST
jgi:hypothetical protein